MTTELFLENNRVDISDSLSSLLTFAIDDVKDFASRQTTFSKTVTLPGTETNNKLFGHIFETGIANDYDPSQGNVGYNFNASKSAACMMFQDNLQTFKGTLRLLQINKDRGNIEYEVALNGDLTTLNVALSSAFLDDLDFSAYDQPWNETNIITSWDNPGGSGVYFPLIDFGTYGRYLGSDGKHDWDFRTFRPSLYVREYIDKMFTAAGFRFQSDLFDTDRFKSLIVPHNQKVLQSLNTRLLSASRNDSAHVIDSGTPPQLALEFSSVVGGIFTASVSNSKFTYNGTTPINLDVLISIFGNYTTPNVGFSIVFRKNGTNVPGTTLIIPISGSTTQMFYTYNASANITLATGDYIEVYYSASIAFVTSDYIRATSGDMFVDSVVAVPAPVEYGGTIQINYTIPKNIRQIDFFSSIVKLFNLYVYEDRFDDRLIYIDPYVDFFSTDSANSVEWTYKLNRDQAVKIKPLSELNSKTYNFDYRQDNDFYNELYKKRYNQGYGSYIFDSEFEFASATNKLELIFASTPLVGYVGEDKVYSTIFKKSADKEENIDSIIRIMQTNKITGVSSWDMMDDIATISTLTDYGYAGHFDDPDAPSNDLNFGVLRELFFQLITGDLTVTQFNVYWSPYMAEITDKDSKMLIGKFYLTPKDIFNLDFSKFVVVDGVLFRLNKITDYNTTIPSDCECQLLKVINTIY